jgi:hypothetical protein
MLKDKNGNFTFELNGKNYVLIFEGKSTRVYFHGVEQKAKTVLREYIEQNELQIKTFYTKKDGSIEKLNTHALGGKFKKYLGITNIKKSKTYITNEIEMKNNIKENGNIGKIIFSNGEVKTEDFIKHSNKYETDINSLVKNVEHLIDSNEKIIVHKGLFAPDNKYNSFIKENVQQKPGVYIWYEKKNKEVLYIGMAGKIKTNGKLTNHPISKRLQATRCKDVSTKEDVSTNKYIAAILEVFEVDEVEFHILTCKENEPAAYIESILLYNYFKEQKVLPILNNAF